MLLKQYKNLNVNDITGKLYDEPRGTQEAIAKAVGVIIKRKPNTATSTRFTYQERLEVAKAIFSYFESEMKESIIQQYKNLPLEYIVQQLYYETTETQQILAKEMGKSLPVSLKKLTYLQRLELAKEIVAYFENENKQIVSTNQTSAIEQQSVSKIQEQIIVQLYTLQVMKDKILHQESKQICQQQIQFLRSLLQTMEG